MLEANAVVGQEINDGSVVWTVQKNSNALSFAGKEADLFALLNSPDFKGTPTAPTAAKTVNNTQIATTAFVHLLAGAANNGGIVDSLLAQNGYVKFANGLILQWGYSTVGSGAWALKFNGVYTAVVVGAPGFPAREFCGFTFDYTLTGWRFTAGYNSPVSYIRPTTTAISFGY